MTSSSSSIDAGLAETLVSRRRGRLLRLLFAGLYALVFGPLTGWPIAVGWAVIYGLLQGGEFHYSRRAATGRPVSTAGALAVFGLNSVAFGSMSVALFLTQGQLGLLAGGLFLAGAVMNTVVSSFRSRAAFMVIMIPHTVYLTAAAVLAWRSSGQGAYGLALGLSIALLLMIAGVLQRTAAEVYDSEHRARQEAERRRREAELAVEAKSAFIAMVSHELRTPISAILAGAEAIERSAGDQATGANAGLIRESGRMMRTLLNDLLDLSKLEAGRMTIEAVPFDLAGLIAETEALWAPEAAQRGLALRVVGADALPAWAQGDPIRLRQILNNLISNALKFTDRGGVTLALFREGTRARFSVIDTGCGMSPAQLDRLFTPFDQTLASIARTHGGTGLGLAISRELARLMGGDLLAESHLREGSTLTLALDLLAAEAPAAAACEPDESGVQVLVVDDHEVNRRAVALMLEPLGAVVTGVESGAEALALLAERPFDVVLMDVHMPDMDGHEACRQLRTRAGPNQHVPVIACTASAAPRDWDACRAAGMSDHVAKPIEAVALHTAIAAALSERPGTETAVA